jgi:hypothetical protein
MEFISCFFCHYNGIYLTNKKSKLGGLVGLWYLTPLSTIFQLYRGGGNRKTQRKPKSNFRIGQPRGTCS